MKDASMKWYLFLSFEMYNMYLPYGQPNMYPPGMQPQGFPQGMGAPPGGMMPGMPGMMPGMAPQGMPPQGMPGMPPVSGTPDQMGYQFYGQPMPGQQLPPGAVAYTTGGDSFNMQGMAGALPASSSEAGANNGQPVAANQSGQVYTSQAPIAGQSDMTQVSTSSMMPQQTITAGGIMNPGVVGPQQPGMMPGMGGQPGMPQQGQGMAPGMVPGLQQQQAPGMMPGLQQQAPMMNPDTNSGAPPPTQDENSSLIVF